MEKEEKEKNMNNERQAGILLSITSLPSKHGIGDFGEEAYQFIDLLSDSHFVYWQILPLNPIGFGGSPYQPYSSFAIDEQFIDLDELVHKGLLSKVKSFEKDTDMVHFEEARAYKLPLLRKAYEKQMRKSPNCLRRFIRENPWVKDWGVFSMFKRRYNTSWKNWPEEAKLYCQKHAPLSPEDKVEANFEIWIQMVAYRQWGKLHTYATRKGIKIIGDIPFYVGYDSCDVWANTGAFLLDEVTLEPTFIAGVPPDYFSETGQRWGNPIYDWEKLEKTDFEFLINRIAINAKIYDVIRLDHFRAFDTYWKIPASCPTAIDGVWVEAPGYAFFNRLLSLYPGLPIIAEDLGDLRPEVLQLRDHFEFPGMNVIQFTFDDCEILHKGDWNRVNSVCYLGTHDNDTTAGFLSKMDEGHLHQWEDALARYGITEGNMTERMMQYCFAKPGKWAILTMQDILEQPSECRINVPGVVDTHNWTYKMVNFKAFKEKLPTLVNWLRRYGR